jgi:hypothetical protein
MDNLKKVLRENQDIIKYGLVATASTAIGYYTYRKLKMRPSQNMTPKKNINLSHLSGSSH